MSADESADRLARTIRRGRRRRAVNLDPATTYEVVTRQMVDDALRELATVRQRVDSLFYLVIASIVVDVVMRLVG
jgi:hypothetical protein